MTYYEWFIYFPDLRTTEYLIATEDAVLRITRNWPGACATKGDPRPLVRRGDAWLYRG